MMEFLPEEVSKTEREREREKERKKQEEGLALTSGDGVHHDNSIFSLFL